MSITEQIEEKFGLKIENLNQLEKETYFKMVDAVQKTQMTPEKMKEYVVSMRDAVEREIVSEPTFIRVLLWKVENPKLIKLQARLQNYMLLESFLMSPERAKQSLEDMVSGLTK